MIDPVTTGFLSGILSTLLGRPLSKLSNRAVFLFGFSIVWLFFLGLVLVTDGPSSRKLLLFSEPIFLIFVLSMSIFFGILGIMIKSLVPPETIGELREMYRDGFRREIIDNGSRENFSRGDLKITATLDEENRRYEVVRYKGMRRLDRYFVKAD